MKTGFEPTRAALASALRQLRPQAYAASRNHLDGAVTRLSPYITHGWLDPAWLLHWLHRHHRLDPQHKLVQEIGWRMFFRHQWRWHGDAIFASLHPGPLPDDAYARALPADVLQARTGVAVIDQAVRALYRDGWLHNHARLWLASYLVHGRKVHWRVGADWMLAYLLDGDLASNHLSWQWVAGTSSAKPYLFDAANVARFAPPSWHSPASAIDRSRDDWWALAHRAEDLGGAQGGDGVVPPPTFSAPPEAGRWSVPDAAAVRGRRVWLIHPWSQRRPPAGALAVAVCSADFHRRWPWSAQRWGFVTAAMQQYAQLRWFGQDAALFAALSAAAAVDTVDDPHLSPALRRWARPAPVAFAEPGVACRSFSAWWSRTRPCWVIDQS